MKSNNPDLIETVIAGDAKIPNRKEHGDGNGDYRIVSSSGKIVSYHTTEAKGISAYSKYTDKFPAEADGSSLQVWHRGRWTVLM